MYGRHPQADGEQRAHRLLAGDACIWCEEAPKAATSHLCDECRKQDPDGVLARAYPLQAVRASRSLA
jgi:hypothetical protein